MTGRKYRSGKYCISAATCPLHCRKQSVLSTVGTIKLAKQLAGGKRKTRGKGRNHNSHTHTHKYTRSHTLTNIHTHTPHTRTHTHTNVCSPTPPATRHGSYRQEESSRAGHQQQHHHHHHQAFLSEHPQNGVHSSKPFHSPTRSFMPAHTPHSQVEELSAMHKQVGVCVCTTIDDILSTIRLKE